VAGVVGVAGPDILSFSDGVVGVEGVDGTAGFLSPSQPTTPITPSVHTNINIAANFFISAPFA
jgi:hypothetical protein